MLFTLCEEERSHGWFVIGECGSWSGKFYADSEHQQKYIFKVVTLNAEEEKNRRQIKSDATF